MVKVASRLHSVGMKLFLIFFICIVVLVVAVGLFSYSQAKSIIQSKVADATVQTVEQLADRLELVFKNYEDVSSQILADHELQNNILKLTGDAGIDQKQEAMWKISGSLNHYTMGKNLISAIHLLPLKSGLAPISTSHSVNTEFAKAEWYKRIVEADGEIVWLPTQNSSFAGTERQQIFALGRVLKNTTTGSEDYVLLIELPAKVLASQFLKLKIGETGSVELQTDAGRLVHAPDPGDIAKTSDKVIDRTLKEASRLKAGITRIESSAKDEKLAVYKKMPTSDWTLVASVSISELVKETHNIFMITLIMAAVAVAAAILAGLYVARMIGRPINILRKLMRESERGNLTVRMNFARKDEIGQLGNSFNRMMEQITELVKETSQCAIEVLNTSGTLLHESRVMSNSAKEIVGATEEIAQGASSLASEAERVNAMMADTGLRIQEVVQSNAKMESAASEVKRFSEQGTDTMRQLSVKTKSIEQITRSMLDKVDQLKESTNSIRKILDLLCTISRQTNILSLNAAIEAARAGVAGKGFMIVADEIRNLADQSNQAIRTVGEITDSIRQEVDDTVSVLSDAYPVFQEQFQSVKEAAHLFDQVQAQMGEFAARLSEAAASIGSLETSQQILAEAMVNVSAVSEESSATSEEVASLSHEQFAASEKLLHLSETMETMANSLQHVLSRFKI